MLLNKKRSGSKKCRMTHLQKSIFLNKKILFWCFLSPVKVWQYVFKTSCTVANNTPRGLSYCLFSKSIFGVCQSHSIEYYCIQYPYIFLHPVLFLAGYSLLFCIDILSIPLTILIWIFHVFFFLLGPIVILNGFIFYSSNMS